MWIKNFLRRRQSVTSGSWDGVYERFSDVPSSGPAFGGELWKDVLTSQLRDVTNGRTSDEIETEHELLLLLVRLLTPASGKLHVVDFGGGYGASCVYLRNAIPGISLQYDVVELPDIVADAGQLDLPDGAHFSDRLGPRHEGADIVFVKSALQYLPDYRAALRSLTALGARFLLLEKFSGVERASFASAQVAAGSSVPYWFISFDDVVGIAGEAGYRPVLRRKLPRIYDLSEFPPGFQMHQASTLLFAS
jgi:putative methyltransferase (TIGR04325 family)